MRKISTLAGCESACGEPRKKAATRIFEAAQDLFYRRGIRAVGVDEIVCEAGVTKPSLYRSFESKDDLVAKCLENFAEEGWVALEARIASAGPEPLAQLHALLGHYADEMAQPGFRGCPMSNAAVEFPEEGHPGRVVAEACKTKLRARIVELTRQVGADDPDALADGLILLIEGAYSAHHVFGSQGPANAFTRSAERLISSHL
jgi:AcrR family transcriptional regulator